ncbi:HAD family hydrolase [Sphingobium subterraneum]|uniref:HAD family hydrolase n=1 Tax=Sphingobium subterraneum TaxID=627688 RepID=A0A841J9X4_9SPHN|nr:HAD family hydrolase [Sphingobium subterraneum]MBB6124941.1 hypothetical protein [Sphingobium subterraneum]
MKRPLIITDCDEVLLHMVVPFRDWLDEAHDVHFSLTGHDFVNALRHKACGTVVERGRVWELLIEFFDTQMDRQQPIAGALETVARLSEIADIVVLTNITERAHEGRIEQLRKLGVEYPVYWNQGGKGKPVAEMVARYDPSVALFVDDLPQHHESVREHAPGVWRLHMVGEPSMAADIPPAPHAHARIDSWEAAEGWIRERLSGVPADEAA